MAEVEVGFVSYTLPADYYARVGADFDAEAVNDAILARLNELVPEGVVVRRNGRVVAEEAVAEDARTIDWDAVLGLIDYDQILADHGR